MRLNYVIVFLIIFLSQSYSQEKVVIIPFFTYDSSGKLTYIQNEYCYGVANSVHRSLELLTNFSVQELDMEPKVISMDINEIKKVYGVIDKYILGVVSYDESRVEYQVFIYGKDGELRKSYKFNKSSQNLFDSVDEISDFLFSNLIPDYKKFAYINFSDFKLGGKVLIMYINGKKIGNVRTGYKNRIRILGNIKYKIELKDKDNNVFASREITIEPGKQQKVSFELKANVNIGQILYKDKNKKYSILINDQKASENTNLVVDAEKNYSVKLYKGDRIIYTNTLYLKTGMNIYIDFVDDGFGKRFKFIAGSGIGSGIINLGVEYPIERYLYVGGSISFNYLTLGEEYLVDRVLIFSYSTECSYFWFNDLEYILNSRIFAKLELMTIYLPGISRFSIFGVLPSFGVDFGYSLLFLRAGLRFDFSFIRENINFIGISPVLTVNLRI